jgi:hypothetical protein
MLTANGIVIPVDWDEEGTATAFAISTFDEKEYRLDCQMDRADLLALVHKEVNIRGTIRDENGEKVLAVAEWAPNPQRPA